MLIVYMKSVELDVTYFEYLRIKVRNFNNIKLSSLGIVTVITDPSSDKELSNKKIVGDSIGEGTIVRFNQALQNYLKVSVGNDTHKLTKYDQYKLQKHLLIDQATLVLQFYLIGKIFVMIKIIMVNYQISLYRQKRTLQQVNQERRVCHQLVMRLCISRRATVTMVKLYFSVLNDLILFKLLI